MPTCFVTTIELTLAEKLRQDLLAQGFTLTTPPYTLFSAQKKGVSCTLYTSGKLTVQGKDKEEFITYYLEPEVLQRLDYTHPEAYLDQTPRIGVDEAGKGDFFGPLSIAGIYVGTEIEKLQKLGVCDSKRLNDETVLRLSKEIKKNFPHHLLRIFPQKYNELYEKFRNLNSLLAWGHATVIEQLARQTGCENVIIDQFAKEYVVLNALKKKDLVIKLTQRHRAEEDLVVAAASILARAGFLEGLATLSDTVSFPLPKGASSLVIQAGKELIASKGKGILASVAKLHFKTKEAILDA